MAAKESRAKAKYVFGRLGELYTQQQLRTREADSWGGR
jgi:hypothetical protein